MVLLSKKIYIKKYKTKIKKIKKSLKKRKKIKIGKKKLNIKKISKYKTNLLDRFSSYIKGQFTNFFGLKSYFQNRIISWKENRNKKQIKILKQQAIQKKRELESLKKQNLREINELKKQKFQFNKQLLKSKQIELRNLEREQKALKKRIEYFLGIDGISVPMVLLTALISCIAVVSSWNIEKLEMRQNL